MKKMINNEHIKSRLIRLLDIMKDGVYIDSTELYKRYKLSHGWTTDYFTRRHILEWISYLDNPTHRLYSELGTFKVIIMSNEIYKKVVSSRNK